MGRKPVNKPQVVFDQVENMRQDARAEDKGRVTSDGGGGGVSQAQTHQDTPFPRRGRLAEMGGRTETHSAEPGKVLRVRRTVRVLPVGGLTCSLEHR